MAEIPLENYKVGDDENQEYIEKLEENENPTIDLEIFQGSNVFKSPAPLESLNELSRLLNSITTEFTSGQISELNEILSYIPPNNLTEDQIEKIFNNMPTIMSLSSHQNTFSMFARILRSPKNAKIVLSLNYIQKIQFEEYPTLNVEIQSFISDTISRLIEADENYGTDQNETLQLFYSTFFPYFFIYFRSDVFFKSNNLSVHLRVAELFIPVVNDEEFAEIFSRFQLFIHRTESEDILAALQGMCACFAKQGDLVGEIRDEDNIKHLRYLASRECVQEGRVSRDVRRSAFVVFEYIASQSTTKCDDLAYIMMYELITKNFQSKESGVLEEAIYLFGFVVANDFFTSKVKYQPLVEQFLNLFDDLTAEAKKEWIQAFANVLYFLPGDYILSLFEKEDFIQKLENSLWFDVIPVQIRLMTSIHNLLFHNPTCVDKFLYNESLMEALQSLADTDDPELHVKVEAVLHIISSSQSE